jgi:hypothetical protein
LLGCIAFQKFLNRIELSADGTVSYPLSYGKSFGGRNKRPLLLSGYSGEPITAPTLPRSNQNHAILFDLNLGQQ